MKKLGILSIGALLATSVGCMTQNEYVDAYDRDSVQMLDRESFAYEGNLELLGGHLRGDIGEVRDLDAEASYLTGYGDQDYVNVEVHADGQRGVAMTLVEIWGGLDQLQPGTTATFRSGEQEYNPSALSVQVIECAGPERYQWNHDAVSDEVVMEVSELEPGVARVDYTARTFEVDPFTGLQTNRTTEVTGHFDVVR